MRAVVMRQQISGTRNGKPWPPVGGQVDLPEQEAEALVASGVATPVGKRKREAAK